MSRVLYYKNNETIIKSGQLEKRMYIILEGVVAITLTDGSDHFPVANLKKGDFFGEISLFTNTPRSATVKAVGDVKLAFIDSEEQLKSFLIKNPFFGAKMVTILAQRLAKSDGILMGKVSEVNRLKVTRDI